MRTRTRGEFEDGTYTGEQINCAGTVTELGGTIGNLNGEVETTVDVVTPNYAKRIAAGEVIVNPYQNTKTSRSSWGGTGGYTCPCTPSNQSFVAHDGYYHFTKMARLQHHEDAQNSVDGAQLMALAGTDATAGIASPAFQGLVFLAELRETIGMLRNPLGATQTYLKKKLKTARAQNSRAKRVAQGNLRGYLESNWLQVRYGLTPLAKDVHDVLTAINHLGEHSPRYTSRGRASSHSELLTKTDTARVGSFDLFKDIETRRTVDVRAGVIYTIDRRSSFGMNIEQVPIALWEVVPFSFVIDWFYNVGDYVQAITPKVGVKRLGSWTTVTTTDVSAAEGYSEWWNTGSSCSSLYLPVSSETLKTVTKKRHAGMTVGLTSQPLPWKGELGTKRIIDAVAIIDTLLRAKLF